MKFPKLDSPAILAPMEAVSDVAFRVLARRFGAGLTYTEFASSAAVIRDKLKPKLMVGEHPVGVQLFGANVDEIVGAAKMLEKDFDVIDINCGCPSYSVMRGGAGSALLKNPEAIGKIVEALVAAVKKPVTVKVRTGFNKKVTAIEIAKIAEHAGAAAIAVHGRTQGQGYAGKADWNVIRDVKNAVNIPVIGNGDVFTPEDFVEKKEFSGVDYVMIGRGAIGNPYIFTQIKDFIKKGSYDKMDWKEQFSQYFKLAKHFGVQYAGIKGQAVFFTKGVSGGRHLREDFMRCKSVQEIEAYFESLNSGQI